MKIDIEPRIEIADEFHRIVLEKQLKQKIKTIQNQ